MQIVQLSSNNVVVTFINLIEGIVILYIGDCEKMYCFLTGKTGQHGITFMAGVAPCMKFLGKHSVRWSYAFAVAKLSAYWA